MRARLITGYVPIENHPRTPAEYGELGEKLSGVPARKKAFYMKVEDTWLYKFIQDTTPKPRVSEDGHPAKNSLEYMCAIHQKTSWLAQAADERPDADWLVWVDYGIFHMPGINNQMIYEVFEKLKHLPDNKIYAPGRMDKAPVESAYPCWRFLASLLAVPRKLVDQFDFACRTTARHHIIQTQNVEWEVNTIARIEANNRYKLPFHWYRADFDGSIFTNFPGV